MSSTNSVTRDEKNNSFSHKFDQLSTCIPGRFVSLTVFLSLILVSFFSQTLLAQTQSTDEQQQFTGHENHKVTLSYASMLTKNFRTMTHATESTVLGEYFGKDALLEALNQEGCTGLRIYYGMKNDGTPALVIVGVDRSGSDMTKSLVLEDGVICPPYCHEGANPLHNVTTPSLSQIEPLSEEK